MIIIFACIISATFITACGSISAPTIDLPAPITGRITVGSPNEEGKVAVIGTEGTFPAESIVLATNETKLSGFVQILDHLIPDIHAYTLGLPLICEKQHHTCVIAESDGSFYLEIDADEGDDISVGIIDLFGNYLLERNRILVPSMESITTPSNDETVCEPGLLANVRDIAVDLTGASFTLKQGSDTSTNLLTIERFDSSGNLILQKKIDLPGCYAKSVSVRKVDTPGGAYLLRIAVISEEDFTLWTGLWDGENILSSKTFTLPYPPLFVDILNVNQLSIIVQAAKNVKATILNIFSETFSDTPLLIASDARAIRHSTLEFLNGDHITAILLDRLGQRAISAFHPEGLRILHEPKWIIDMGMTSATDIHLFFDPEGSSPFTPVRLPKGIVEFIIVDHDANRFHITALQSDLGPLTVLHDPINIAYVKGTTFLPIDLPGTSYPRLITSIKLNTNVLGFILMEDTSIYKFCLGGTCAAGGAAFELFASGAQDTVDIVANDEGDALFVADRETGAIDRSDILP